MKNSATVSAVLLAAGPSGRFSKDLPKQLLPFQGEPMVRRVARAALGSKASQVIVVVGHAATGVSRAVADLDVEIAVNRAWSQGQSSSVRAGLERVTGEAAAVLFAPVDQPLLTSGLFNLLIERFLDSEKPIVVPVADGRRGSPVVFERALFHELRTLSGDTGGRQLFGRHADDILEVEIGDPRLLLDIDTPDDYQYLLAALQGGSEGR